MDNIAAYIDHTILKPAATQQDIIQLCREAIEYGFASVCVPPCYVAMAHKLSYGTDVKVSTVIGFPFGYNTIDTKLAEIEIATNNGAHELDMVHNISAIKSGNWEYVEQEIAVCTRLVHNKLGSIKVILETAYLSDEEIIKCCGLYAQSGIDYLKTSTGFAETGATLHAVQLMRQNLPGNIGIKAAGGIRNLATASEFISAGATRIGTSAGIAIVKEAKEA